MCPTLAARCRPTSCLLIGLLAAMSCGTGGAGAPGRAGKAARALPNKLVFRLDSHQLIKDGEQIHETEARNLFSTMPQPRGTPREATLLSEHPLSLETFAEVWAVLSAFDFAPWRKLTPADFVLLPGPSDTSYSNRLYLQVDDVEVIDLSLPMGPPREPALRDKLDRLREDIERPLRAAEAKRALANVAAMPKSFQFDYGRWRLSKQAETIFLQKYCLFPPDSEWIERARPELQRAAAANPGKIRLGRSHVEVALSEADFQELWQELRKVDFVRLAGIGREGYLFRPQPVTWSLVLQIDDRLVLNLQYTDRELSEASAKPLLPITERFEAKLKQKLDGLSRRQGMAGSGTL